MEDAHPTCSICLDTLIAPVTMPCGHSTCFKCSGSLDTKCPECRSNRPKDCKVNIILDQLLSKIVPDYDKKRKDIMVEVEREALFKNYKLSARRRLLTDVIDDYFMMNGHISREVLFDICKHAVPDSTLDEIMYILSIMKETQSIADITIEGLQYFVSGDRDSYIETFAAAHRDHLTQSDIYNLACAMHDGIAGLMKALNIDVKRALKWDRDALAEHLAKVNLNKPKPEYDDELESSSSDDEDEDDEDDDDDDEESD